jgi:uncharacterized membrane protein YhaH (DUF805 family)
MGFGAAISSCFSKYAVFKGRAPRSEYWFWRLFVMLVSLAAGAAAGVAEASMGTKMPGHITSLVLELVFFLPDISVAVRRLHDLNRSGWWLGASIILMLFIVTLAIPVIIRAGENHANGLPAIEGIPVAAFGVIAALGLAQVILGFTLFVWFCMRGTIGTNQYGPDPLRDPWAPGR